jgi:hypothetical protein
MSARDRSRSLYRTRNNAFTSSIDCDRIGKILARFEDAWRRGEPFRPDYMVVDSSEERRSP